MRVAERLSADGRRLFQLRSLMPLALLVPLFFALMQIARFELRWGEEVEDWWLVFCVSISTLGLAMRCLTVGFVPAGTSGRGRGAPSAATLNTGGMYSVVRNPLYLANGIM
jgi:protein-S-isoprenylcysteine O-methyltransferase Ste14